MAIRKLEPNDWHFYMDRVSKRLPASTVTCLLCVS